MEKAKKERLKVAKSDMEKSLAVFLPRKQQDEERQGASADNVVLTEEESNFKDETLVCPVFNGITFTNANFSGCRNLTDAAMEAVRKQRPKCSVTTLA